jgi:hypothetical protein
MAKIKLGSNIVGISGKMAGHVFANNRGGNYMRVKTKPTNPRTVAQMGARNRFTSLSQAWKSITDAQRNAWNAAVSNWGRTNVFGDIKSPTGAQLFQKLNNNLVNCGSAQISDVPQPAAVFAFTSLAIAAAAGAGTMTATFAPAIPAGTKVLVFATAPQSAGKSYVTNLYRQIGVLSTTDISPKTIAALYTAKYGSVGLAGQKIFVKMVPVNLTNGQSGQGITAMAIIAA